ncbi:MAG: oligopeptide:H+ symporter [Chthoniobacterales bacterium]|nr:oligopeptide:H+ symporter [Chthoniobacterales bacterium]
MEIALKKTQHKAALCIIAVIMWEFFSFYGLKAILVLYFTSQLHFSDSAAYQLFGSFISLVFITPILGGWLADRYCGYRYATATGSVLIILGHLMLTAFGQNVFIGLSLLTMGIGFFKSNAVCLISTCYYHDPVGATAAFSWYYVAGNIGSMLAGMICPYLVENVSWDMGFIVAAFGMMLGFLIFLASKRYFKWEQQTKKTEAWEHLSLTKKALLTGSILITSFLFFYEILLHDWVAYLLMLVVIMALTIFTKIYRGTTPAHKKGLIMMAVLTVFVTSFWVFSNQVSSSYPLFIFRYVNRTIMGWTIPTGMFQSLNAASILIAGAVMAFLWRWMGRHHIRPQTDTKVSIALILLVLGFGAMTYASRLASEHAPISMFLPILSIVMLGVAELFTEPVMLASWGDIAPHNSEGRLVAIYFLFIGAIGNYLSIWISKLTVDPVTSKATAFTYHTAYSQVTRIALALLGLLLARIVWRKLTHIFHTGSS